MYSHYNYNYARTVVILHPGEYYITDEDCMISTVLGSCVSVTLYDTLLKLGGMNHYMLPGKGADHIAPKGEMAGKLGIHAMALLIEELRVRGASLQRFEAKVFGGGNVLRLKDRNGEEGEMDIGAANVDFAFTYLKRAGIPVVSSDVRDYAARKIFLDAKTGYVYLKRMESSFIEPIKKVEISQIKELKEQW